MSPAADDSDEDDVLDVEDEDDQFGRCRYLEECRRLGIGPASQVLKLLESEELHVTHYGLGLKGMVAVCSALHVNQNVTVLRLLDNAIPDEGITALAACLADNRITELDLSGNRCGSGGACALSQLLSTRGCVLRSVVLSRMRLSDKDGALFGPALENNSTLRILDVSHNDLALGAARAFGNMLATNLVLQQLNLSFNKLRPKGIASIVEGMKPNLALQALGMAWCGVHDEGAASVKEMLLNNQGLVDIDLSGNGITSAGIMAIAAGVGASPSLAAVALDNNDVREDGGQALLKAVELNKALVECLVESTNVPEAIKAALDSILGPRRAKAKG